MSEQSNEPEQPDPERDADVPDSESVPKGKHIITAKDAGWRPSGLFVAPGTFVKIDPPEPKNRRESS